LSAQESINELLDKSLEAVNKLKALDIDADTLIYREEQLLNRFIRKILKLEDKKLARETLNKINLVKEDMKTIARRLYVSAHAQEKRIFKEYKKPTAPLSEKIKKLGIDVESIENTLSRLKIDDMDQITSKAEKELDDLKKIELDIQLIMPKIEKNLVFIKNHAYLIEDDIAEKIKARTAQAEGQISSAKQEITDQAELLLQDIEIIKKIK
jgi:hypothetical protein